MATKSMTVNTQIKLSQPAKAKLAGILRGTQTDTRKKSLQQSKGVYALYKAKWPNNQ